MPTTLAATLPRSNRLSKWYILLVIAYILLPFDIIPDFLPILGLIDDAILIFTLIVAAIQRFRRPA